MKRVIYTVIIGGYDQIIEPPAFPDWDYICFTDRKRPSLRAAFGLSKWQSRTFDSEGLDAFRLSRLPKILPHRYLQDYDYSVYIDGNAKLLADPSGPLESMGWPDFAVSEHPYRDTVLEEIQECMRQNKAPLERLEAQREAYLADNIPEGLPLWENNLLLRRHKAPQLVDLMEAWWVQMNTFSHRDQLSLPYVAWKQAFTPHVFTQDMKRTLFTTKAHYRAPWTRWQRSLKKRLDKGPLGR